MTYKDDDIFVQTYNPATNSMTKAPKPEFAEVSSALYTYFTGVLERQGLKAMNTASSMSSLVCSDSDSFFNGFALH